MRLISVVMKSNTKDNRSSDTIGMMEYGYSTYGSEVILKKSEYTGEINISGSENKEYKYDLIVNEEVKKASYLKVLINNLKDIITGNIRKK